jgi:hypothetical protein
MRGRPGRSCRWCSQGAGDVDPGALGLRRGGVGPAAQAAGPAQLAQHGLAFGVGLLGPLDVPGPVGRVQLGVQGGQAAARSRAGMSRPGAASKARR